MSTEIDNIQSEGRETKLLQRRTIPLIAMGLLVIVILVLPTQTEYRVYVGVMSDKIYDVAAETIRVPLISTLFRSNQQKTGVYTIIVRIQSSGYEYTISNVPSGMYIFLISNVTNGVSYTIDVQLLKNNLIIDTFTLHTSF